MSFSKSLPAFVLLTCIITAYDLDTPPNFAIAKLNAVTAVKIIIQLMLAKQATLPYPSAYSINFLTSPPTKNASSSMTSNKL